MQSYCVHKQWRATGCAPRPAFAAGSEAAMLAHNYRPQCPNPAANQTQQPQFDSKSQGSSSMPPSQQQRPPSEPASAYQPVYQDSQSSTLQPHPLATSVAADSLLQQIPPASGQTQELRDLSQRDIFTLAGRAVAWTVSKAYQLCRQLALFVKDCFAIRDQFYVPPVKEAARKLGMVVTGGVVLMICVMLLDTFWQYLYTWKTLRFG